MPLAAKAATASHVIKALYTKAFLMPCEMWYMELFMLFKDITIVDENLDVLNNMYVGTIKDKIAYIGNSMPTKDYGEVYEGKNKVLMTGLINTHTHTPMTLLRGYAENTSLQDWLFNNIFPFERKMQKEDVYYSALLGIAEMIKYGTVSSTDMYFHSQSVINAVIDSGFKMNISAGITSFDDKPLKENANFIEEKYNYDNYHNSEGGRIKSDMSLHAEYTTNPSIVSELIEYCRGVDANIHVHIAETETEVLECKERHSGMTPVKYFDSLGLFSLPVNAAHCVWLEDEDFLIFSKNNVNIAHCPISNLKLASGVLNINQVLKNNINLSLGTDSAASNNNLNLFEELKTFSLIHKGVSYDPTLITPKQALKSATINGAVAQKRYDCGKLKVGNKADLIVIDTDTPNMMPSHNLLNNIVYSMDSSNLILTMIDGQVLYKNGEYLTIDLQKVFWNVEKSRLRILKELK